MYLRRIKRENLFCKARVRIYYPVFCWEKIVLTCSHSPKANLKCHRPFPHTHTHTLIPQPTHSNNTAQYQCKQILAVILCETKFYLPLSLLPIPDNNFITGPSHHSRNPQLCRTAPCTLRSQIIAILAVYIRPLAAFLYLRPDHVAEFLEPFQ